MRKVAILGLLGCLLVAGGWWLMGGERRRSGDETPGRASVAPTAVVARDDAKTRDEPLAVANKPSPSGTKQEREQLRRRILDALEARERAPSEHDAGSTGSAPEAPERERPAAGASAPDDTPPEAGDLTDRTGDHGYLMKVMNEDLLPLANECYTLARETQPELAGMLVLDFEIIGDEDIGGIVETVEPGQNNELVEPVLLECMRESILSTTLPAPTKGGRDALSLSLRFEPDEG